MNKTYNVKVCLTSGETVYITDAENYGWQNTGMPVFWVDKDGTRNYFNADAVKYVGRVEVLEPQAKEPEGEPEKLAQRITWQQAVLTLKEACASVSGNECQHGSCPLGGWCKNIRGKDIPPVWWSLPEKGTKEG